MHSTKTRDDASRPNGCLYSSSVNESRVIDHAGASPSQENSRVILRPPYCIGKIDGRNVSRNFVREELSEAPKDLVGPLGLEPRTDGL